MLWDVLTPACPVGFNNVKPGSEAVHHFYFSPERKAEVTMAGIPDAGMTKKNSIYLSEYFMGAACVLTVAAGIASLVLCVGQQDTFAVFGLLVRLVTAVAMYQSFRRFKWDVAKGLMGGALFSIMYHEAFLVLVRLWGEQDFDLYLAAGVQGSLYLASAGMAFLMTVIITINHFFINYAIQGNPKNMILNRIAILFKLVVYLLLLVSNSRLDFAAAALWKNALLVLTDMFLLLLLVNIESQFDSFNALRQELRKEKRKGRSNK